MTAQSGAVDARQFEVKLQAALERARLVLDGARDLELASNAHHQYQDKYLMAECMTNAAVASHINCLSSVLGISSERFVQLVQWSEEKAVSLRFSLRETCDFDRSEEREVKSPTKHVTEGSIGGLAASLTSSVVTTVTDYWWTYTSKYEILAFRGVGQETGDQLQLVSGCGLERLKTSSNRAPRQSVSTSAHEVNISWLLRQLAPQTSTPRFNIDRAHSKCRTPRRNKDVEAACRHFADFHTWATRVSSCLVGLFRVNPDPAAPLPLDRLEADASILVPVLPLLASSGGAQLDRPDAAADLAAAAALAALTSEASSAEVAIAEPSGGETGAQVLLAATSAPPGSVALGDADTNRFLVEELTGLRASHAALRRDFPGNEGTSAAASAAEAVIATTLRHCSQVCSQWTGALGFVEDLLRKQLIAAIGKEVSSAEFAEYMRFHNRKLFADGYVPVPFCFPVRRSEHHTPEGTVSIEEQDVGASGGPSMASPSVTMVAKAAGQHPMQFPLGASTTVSFEGERHLHAWLSHRFSTQSMPKVSLVSRARQFSSMIVLVGRIASATSFEPKYAAIVQNKDELSIPLDLSTIPTPKEFKDAIESLSPEQQAFAKAFRSMQLESTLFGILVIQIKPQLEKVLNLPANSLTKEIKLTQDLMQLFIKYQIPSDLLSFDSESLELVGGANTNERLEAVRSHVAAMQAMIDQAKTEEVDERRLQQAYHNPFAAQPSHLEPAVDDLLGMSESLDWGACELKSASVTRGLSMPSMGMGGMGGLFGGGSMGAQKEGISGLFGAGSMRSAKESAMSLKNVVPSAVSTPLMAASASSSGPHPGAQQQQQQQQQQQPQQQPIMPTHDPTAWPEESTATELRDYTQVPKEIDARLEQLDADGAVRPTIIHPGKIWTKRAQKALLAKPTETTLGTEEQKSEKDAAFDLLDALTKSGALAVEHASLHVVVAATHCFDKTVTETVVQENANPIEKVERSTLIMASTVHRMPPAALIRDAHQPRVQAASPDLFLEGGAASIQMS